MRTKLPPTAKSFIRLGSTGGETAHCRKWMTIKFRVYESRGLFSDPTIPFLSAHRVNTITSASTLGSNLKPTFAGLEFGVQCMARAVTYLAQYRSTWEL